MLNKIFLFLIVVALFLAGCKREAPQASDQSTDSNLVELNSIQMKQITTDTVKVQEERTDLVLSGKVTFDKDFLSPVYSLVSGNVLKVNASQGDYVKQGQTLAILKSADVSNYESQYAVAQNQLKTARRNLDIANELFKTKVYSEKDVMQAQNDYKAAVATLHTVETYLKTYKVIGTDTNAVYTISSPIDGYVVSKSVNEGMNVRTDNTNPLFTISYLKTVWVLANVYENDIPQISTGDSADITTVAYPDKKRKGVISKMGNVLDSSASTMQARIVLDNKDSTLKSGMFATVVVHLDKHKKALAVPKEALVFYDNQYYVMVSKGNSKFEKRAVTIEGTNQTYAYVSKGLQPNEVVVCKNSLYVYGQ
ncbi:MAG TPA: efflux RND transporter periplasmic adaptor subunit [Bacteroidia bacterium]|jgi:cobalt-zinc-cadmium efflux system membrane fusion protein|nr:efflux RND transporter periplasmic adaptor subunit [Bacteroidia bacterium]